MKAEALKEILDLYFILLTAGLRKDQARRLVCLEYSLKEGTLNRYISNSLRKLQ